jgi:arylsulfatase A-like enzyme
MNRRIKRSFFPLTLAAGLLLFLFWPFSSRRWDIAFDQEMIDNKNKYLAGLSAAHRHTGSLSFGTTEIRRPNIILITADDLGKMDVSLYGGTALETPHIDSIGTQGVTFTEGYATAAICCPSRAGLMTGRDQNRFGFTCHMIDIYLRNRAMYWLTRAFVDTDNMTPVYQKTVPRRAELWKQGLPPSEITLGELLHSAGYHTGIVGKWHLGYNEIHHPNQRGFDYQYGFLEAFSLYAEKDRTDIVNYEHDLFWEKHIWRQGRKGPCAITRNGEPVEEEEYLTDAIARESIGFIRDHLAQRGSEPFFLYTAFNAPHTPFQATEEYYLKFSHLENRAQRVYCAMVSQLDDAVGRILREVEESAAAENTLIIFSSDNGGAVYTGGTTNAPLKGGKMTHFEGGLNVPFLMRWKGVFPAGTIIDDPVIQTDLFATVAAASGSPLPRDRVYDGVDLLPFILGIQTGRPHSVLHWKTYYGSIIRQGPWKLLINSRTGLVRLYNLEEDKSETSDRSAARPEVLQELRREIRRWEQQLPDPLWPPLMEIRWEIDGDEVIFPL